mgnify:CR=1 FL=1
MRPEVLLLDEPTAGVDPKARRDFWEQIHQLAAEGLTFLITTHYMDEAERCHALAILDRGHIVANGSPQQLMADLTQRAERLALASVKVQAFLDGCDGVVPWQTIGRHGSPWTPETARDAAKLCAALTSTIGKPRACRCARTASTTCSNLVPTTKWFLSRLVVSVTVTPTH